MKKSFLAKQVVSFLVLLQIFLSTTIASTHTSTRALPTVPANSLAAITQKELKMHLSFLASQELGGRYTFSSGNRIAARYLASQLESFGYHGAASDGSFFQPIDFVANLVDAKKSYINIVNNPSNTPSQETFTFGKDFFTAFASPVTVTSSVVFVGYGISIPEEDDFAKVDVKNKIVLVSSNLPKSLSNRINYEQYGATAAYVHGASVVLKMPEDEVAPNWSDYDVNDEELFEMTKAKSNESGGLPVFSPPTLEISPNLAKILLGSIDLSLENFFEIDQTGKAHTSKQLPISLDLKISTEKSYRQTQNVVGIYDGADPKLKKEYTMLSAHYDHLKTEGKNVYCGADDDGSGTSAILTIAHVLANGPTPKRSILVVFHTGEEIGLYGSKYFTDVEPLVPLDSIVVDLNADMIGRSRTEKNPSLIDRELSDKDTLYLIGSDKHSTQLHKLSEQTNSEITSLHLNYTYNDERHPSRLFYRSDHYNYARKGIPIIFYFTGLHADYHRPTDTVEKIDFDKLSRISRLIYATAWRVANLDERLIVDRWKK